MEGIYSFSDFCQHLDFLIYQWDLCSIFRGCSVFWIFTFNLWRGWLVVFVQDPLGPGGDFCSILRGPHWLFLGQSPLNLFLWETFNPFWFCSYSRSAGHHPLPSTHHHIATIRWWTKSFLSPISGVQTLPISFFHQQNQCTPCSRYSRDQSLDATLPLTRATIIAIGSPRGENPRCGTSLLHHFPRTIVHIRKHPFCITFLAQLFISATLSYMYSIGNFFFSQ